MLIFISNFNPPPLFQVKPVIPKSWFSCVLPLMIFGTFPITLMPRSFKSRHRHNTIPRNQAGEPPAVCNLSYLEPAQLMMGPSLSSHNTLTSLKELFVSLWECFRNQVSSINDFLFFQELWTCFKELGQICLPWCCPSLTKPISTVPQQRHPIIPYTPNNLCTL